MLRLLFWYLPVVNVLTYGVFWWDKRRARKGQRRISERELLGWALAGGSLGAFLAMRHFRHKTQKTSFRVWFWLVVAAQVGLLAYLALRGRF